MDLAKQLKVGTKKSHSAAENTSFVASFLRGVVDEESYRTLVSDLYFVYRAMEEEVRRLKDNEFVKAVYFPELERELALERDVRYYWGPNWRAIITPSDSAQLYANRIREIGIKDPLLLVAHHYTRYLGDLSGGQILKGIAEKALNLREGEGLHFYEFEQVEDTKEFKVKYRAALDTLELDQSQIDAIIAEANYAFKLNMYVFDELAGGTGDSWKSFFKVLLGFIKRK
tara:strand:+ start:2270 stop:2953 length:684 start_codon:yes stop_codon:yes gene_type:complete